MTMAANRHDRVVAIDACPDQEHALPARAGLPDRGVGVRDMVYAGRTLASLADVRRYLASAGPTGLEVLPGVQDAAFPGPTAEELRYALAILEYWFPVVIVDAPLEWGEPPSAALLARTDTLVVAMEVGDIEPEVVDTALDALESLGRGDLMTSCVVAVVETDPPRFPVWRRRIRPGRFVQEAHAVVRVPYDPALAGGGPFTWPRLRRRTRAAFEELAAAVGSAPC
jgi:MinD-like ATPase involved in chromosome partitioning or flagellar assembly